MNQIKNEGLREQVDTVIDTKNYDSSFDTRFDFDVKGTVEKFSVWIDEDPGRNKLYRLSPGENSSKNSTNSGTSSSSSSTKSGNKDFKPSGFFDSKSHDLVTLEEYKEKSANDFSIRPLTTKEKMPNNFFYVNNEGIEITKLWIGKWISNKNN